MYALIYELNMYVQNNIYVLHEKKIEDLKKKKLKSSISKETFLVQSYFDSTLRE